MSFLCYVASTADTRLTARSLASKVCQEMGLKILCAHAGGVLATVPPQPSKRTGVAACGGADNIAAQPDGKPGTQWPIPHRLQLWPDVCSHDGSLAAASQR